MNVYLGELYKEVEYIQSSGTQYINTGYIPSNTTKIQISMGGWTYVQQYAHLFGVRAVRNTTDASIGRGFLLCHQYNTSYIGMFGRGYSNNSGGWSSTTFSFANGNNHIIEMSQSGVYEDGTLKASLQTVTFTSPSNMCIFALNDNGTVKENSSYKLYYFKIWNNGTLVRDFVPCYRVSDNVIGLFDKVENKFYTNAGTGTFTKGNDVKVFQPELKNAYIGEVYEYSINFRDYSNISQVQALGWSFLTAGSTVVAAVNQTYGFHNSNYANNTWWFCGYRSIPSLANAKKITINMSGYGPSSASNAAYSRLNVCTTDNFDAGLSGFFRFGSAGQTDRLALASTDNWNQDIGSGASYSGQFTLTLVADLVNKIATYTSTGKALSGSHSLSDSDISYIRTLNILKVQSTAYADQGINNQIWSAGIIIE